MWKILQRNLGVKPFKTQLVQELKPHELAQCKIFGEWALGSLLEAHFWLNGYVNKQNCRFWSEEEPEELQKLPILTYLLIWPLQPVTGLGLS